jgi:hypothetical protein
MNLHTIRIRLLEMTGILSIGSPAEQRQDQIPFSKRDEEDGK